mmetsp:Transcript_18002/g.69699  ORF Transcript_18002/g.69699 Transcript_18002/m.69699 type:complete len:100 (+) Transcript_18002:56-355(+)
MQRACTQGLRLAARRQAPNARRSMGYFENLPNEGKSYGYLFARKPTTKPKVEGWENIMYYGFFGTMALMTVGMWLKPEKEVFEWAREEIEARKRAALEE